jgi:hypothetical protein
MKKKAPSPLPMFSTSHQNPSKFTQRAQGPPADRTNPPAPSSPKPNQRHLPLQPQLVTQITHTMCLEIFKHFRCDCEEYMDDESHAATSTKSMIWSTTRASKEHDPKVDKLYDKCDGVGTKKYEAK